MGMQNLAPGEILTKHQVHCTLEVAIRIKIQFGTSLVVRRDIMKFMSVTSQAVTMIAFLANMEGSQRRELHIKVQLRI